jgi:hypothetical protein
MQYLVFVKFRIVIATSIAVNITTGSLNKFYTSIKTFKESNKMFDQPSTFAKHLVEVDLWEFVLPV